MKEVLHERCRDSEQLSEFDTETKHVSPEDTTFFLERKSEHHERERESSIILNTVYFNEKKF